MNGRIARPAPKALELGAGRIIIPEYSRTGGIHTESQPRGRKEINEGAGLQAKYAMTKTVDDVWRLKQATRLLTRAYYVTDRHCATTPLGYWISEDSLPRFQDEMAVLQAAIDEFNADSIHAGSDIRMVVEYYPIELPLNFEAAAQRLARHVRERLSALVLHLRTGARNDFELEMERCRNLDKLATGIQREAIEQALECAREQKKVMLAALREGDDLASRLDLEPIVASERLFY